MTTTNECCGNFEYAGTYMKRHHCDKYTKPVLDLDIVKGYVLCTAEHCSTNQSLVIVCTQANKWLASIVCAKVQGIFSLFPGIFFVQIQYIRF